MVLIIDVHNTHQFDSLFTPPLCMVPQAIQAIFKAVVNPTAKTLKGLFRLENNEFFCLGEA